MERIGIHIKPGIGIGDAIQFSSLPENYYRATGKKLIDLNRSWFFDYNPFVERGVKPDKTIELWNFPKVWEWPKPRSSVYTCNAEIWASLLKVPVILNHPRLYRFEDVSEKTREKYLIHIQGRSHGLLPKNVIDFILIKYRNMPLYQIGLPTDPPIAGIKKIETKNLWDLARVISEARMFIGIDSGPSWIAACYPGVISKKIRNREVHGQVPFSQWVPLEVNNIHSHWDDRGLFKIFHTGEEDQGFLTSYKKI